MTVEEFKAWYRGYRETFVDGIPSKGQIMRVEAELAKVYNTKAVNGLGEYIRKF